MTSHEFRYAAFISYNHNQRDAPLAEAIARKIESFALPKLLGAGKRRKRIGRVYRDLDEAPAGSALSEEIIAALEKSAKLVVICSPEAQASEWVNQEVEYFVSSGRTDDIVPLLSVGEPVSVFPASLLEISGKNIPIAADFRGYKGGRIKDAPSIELNRLISGLLNVRYDDIVRRLERSQRSRNRVIVLLSMAAAIVTTLVTFVMYDLRENAIVAASEAQTRRQEAEDQRFRAEKQEELAKASAERALLAVEVADEQRSKAEAQRIQAEIHLARNRWVLSGDVTGAADQLISAIGGESRLDRDISESAIQLAYELVDRTSMIEGIDIDSVRLGAVFGFEQVNEQPFFVTREMQRYRRNSQNNSYEVVTEADQPCDNGVASGLSLSPNHRILAVLSEGYVLCTYRSEDLGLIKRVDLNGIITGEFSSHSYELSIDNDGQFVSFSPFYHSVISFGSADDSRERYESRTGPFVVDLNNRSLVYETSYNEIGPGLAATISKDGKLAAVVTAKNEVTVVETDGDQSEIIITIDDFPSDRWVESLTFDPENRFLLISAAENQLRIFDLTNQRFMPGFSGFSSSVESTVFSEDGTTLLIVCSDNGYVIDWESNTFVTDLPGHIWTEGVTEDSPSLLTAALSHSGESAVSIAMYDDYFSARQWELRSRDTDIAPLFEFGEEGIRFIEGDSSRRNLVLTKFAARNDFFTAEITEIDEDVAFENVASPDLPESAVEFVTVNRTGGLVAVHAARSLYLWSREGEAVLGEIPLQYTAIDSKNVQFDPTDDVRLFFVDWIQREGTIGGFRLVEFDARKSENQFRVGRVYFDVAKDHLMPRSLSISSNGQYAAVGFLAGKVVVFDLETLEVTSSFSQQKRLIRGLDINHDGNLVASASWDGSIWLHNILTGVSSRIHQFSEENNSHRHFSDLSFSPDNKTIAASVRDRILLWDVASEKHTADIETGFGRILSFLFSEDGGNLIYATEFGVLATRRVFDLDYVFDRVLRLSSG